MKQRHVNKVSKLTAPQLAGLLVRLDVIDRGWKRLAASLYEFAPRGHQ
jgi:hypothetical protein